MGGAGGTIQAQRNQFSATSSEGLDQPPCDEFSKFLRIQFRASPHCSPTLALWRHHQQHQNDR